jgi:hypothetical protein
LDVKYTAGQINTDSNGFVTGITGLQKDAVNVVVTGSIPVSLTTSDDVSFMTKSGTAVSIVEAGAGKETTAHELAHHFLGDTKSSAGIIQNVFADVINDMARTNLGSFGRWQNSVFGTQTYDRANGIVSKFENFRTGAQSFSVSTDPAANRPQTK